MFGTQSDIICIMAMHIHNELLVELGKKIREARKAKGFSQKQFSYASEIEKASLSRIENGKTNISFITLTKICLCLEIAMHELFD